MEEAPLLKKTNQHINATIFIMSSDSGTLHLLLKKNRWCYGIKGDSSPKHSVLRHLGCPREEKKKSPLFDI